MRSPRTAPSAVLLALTCVLTLVLAACGGDPAADATGTAEVGGNQSQDCVDDADPDVDHFPDKVTFDEAAGVSVRYENTYKVVDVTPPQVPDADAVRYVLLQCGAPEPELTGDLAGAQLIEVPLERVVSLTTTNLPHFDALGAVDRLVGVGTIGFVATESAQERAEAGHIDEFADELGAPDLERLLDTEPELLIIDGFGDTILDEVGRYISSGLPTVINADFNERSLLGRAEWLKFTALFLNAEAAATDAYEEIATAYADIADTAAGADEQPRVLVNVPFEGTWFAPGGESFQANAIADAGGEYVFADDDSTGSLQLDIETVLDRAADADVWIQAGSMHGSLADLLETDERFAQFDAFREGAVWAWDRWLTPGGGNAVFEVAYTRADLFLADLVAIFHPDLLPEHELTFFGPVPE